MPSTAAPEARRLATPRFLLALLLLLSGPFWLHFGAWHYPFVNYDDPDYVQSNAMVQQGLNARTFLWAFSTQAAANWHPLTWISHLLDVTLFGLDAGKHHLTSLALHGLAALCLCMALVVATGLRVRSWCVAAIYLAHPLAVESTLWIAERKDVLSACFGLASLWVYVVAQRRARPRLLWGAWSLFVLGLLAKPMLVSWPFVLLLVDRWPLARNSPWSKLWREKWAWFGAAAAVALLTWLAQRDAGAVSSAALIDWSSRLSNAAVAYARYLGKFFWPQALVVSYPHPALVPGWDRWAVWQLLASVALLVALLGLAFKRRQGPVGVGIAWWFGMLIPVIGIVQVGSQSMADRYMLLPSIGLSLALVFSLSAAWARRLWPLAAVALVLLSWRAHVQGGHWRNSRALFEHAVAASAHNWLAWNNLGNVRRAEGDAAAALAAYDASLRIQPDYVDAHYNRGNALVDLRRLEAAESSYRSALRLDPSHVGARVNLARVYLATQRPHPAVELLRQALQLSPQDLAIRLNLAQALHGLGEMGEAQAVLDGASGGQWAAAPPAVRQRELALRQRLRADAGEMP